MGQIIQTDQIIEHIYIHIPFCVKKCFYCSFFSIEFDHDIKNQYLEFLKKELELYKKQFQIKAKTIYFGGGTPSLLNPNEIQTIIALINKESDAEISLECNPISITKDYLQKIKDAGINRISMGVQSFNDKILSYLGRLHNAKTANTSIDLIKKCKFISYSVDLIYGIPGQTKADFLKDIQHCIDEHIPHISFYCLSLDESVELYKEKAKLPEDELIHEMYFAARELLINADYLHYEISNFSLKGHHSRHNSTYWQGKAYIGLGASASGYLNNYRYTNSANIQDYFKQIKKSNLYLEKDLLNKDELEKEYIITHLRTAEGIIFQQYQEQFNEDFLMKYQKEILKLHNNALVEYDTKHFYIKAEAYLVSNEILLEFI